MRRGTKMNPDIEYLTDAELKAHAQFEPPENLQGDDVVADDERD